MELYKCQFNVKHGGADIDREVYVFSKNDDITHIQNMLETKLCNSNSCTITGLTVEKQEPYDGLIMPVIYTLYVRN